MRAIARSAKSSTQISARDRVTPIDNIALGIAPLAKSGHLSYGTPITCRNSSARRCSTIVFAFFQASAATGRRRRHRLRYRVIAFSILGVIIDACFARLRLPIGAVMRFIGVWAVTGLGLSALLLERRGFSPDTAGAFPAYAFAGQLYIFVFTLSLASISANLLIVFAREPVRRVDASVIFEGPAMVAARLKRMSLNGLLIVDDAGLRLTPAGDSTVRNFSTMRAFFQHREPGDAEVANAE